MTLHYGMRNSNANIWSFHDVFHFVTSLARKTAKKAY